MLGKKIEGRPIDFGVLPCGYVPLDVDTFAMDNSGTAKELVGRTYAGVDGYCPLVAYLQPLISIFTVPQIQCIYQRH